MFGVKGLWGLTSRLRDQGTGHSGFSLFAFKNPGFRAAMLSLGPGSVTFRVQDVVPELLTPLDPYPEMLQTLVRASHAQDHLQQQWPPPS